LLSLSIKTTFAVPGSVDSKGYRSLQPTVPVLYQYLTKVKLKGNEISHISSEAEHFYLSYYI
jgi:hypothetical protein